MNQIIVLLIVIAMHFGLNESCPDHRVVITNQLGKGRALQYRCTGSHDGSNTGIRTLAKFNQSYQFLFRDWPTSWTDEQNRSRFVCDLSWGPQNENRADNIEVYRAAMNRRCGLLRQYIAREDGFYYRSAYNVPVGWVRGWTKK
ncbi:hypothetical protein EUTSA_v10026508mg [Eutrema salsugineum]|uniref:Uncharacterized protein n=1 Tax=Eutrema salsugineum TaxID=72664 RepID=V4P6E0_EUTSA|nr:hypothetical protein EUTSA_v10026508mg [Eutrema salsugineum]